MRDPLPTTVGARDHHARIFLNTPTSKQAVVTVPPRLARPAETPKLLGPTRLAHDGFGFHTNFPGNFVGITLLEFRQEEFDG